MLNDYKRDDDLFSIQNELEKKTWDPKLWEKSREACQGQMRTVYRCKKSIKINKIEYRCEIKFRSDYRGSTEHQCTFQTIRQYFQPEKPIDPLYQMFISHIARCNISLSAASSKPTFSFIHELIREGQRSVLLNSPPNSINKDKIPTAQTIFPQRSRQTLSRNLHEIANQRRSDYIKQLQTYHYACLQVDAGKINGMPILDICITHAFCSQNPLLFKAYRHFDGTKDSYKELIKQTILELQSSNITISTIVGDNLPVQKAALDHSYGSMQEDNIETSVGLPIFFPCICHTLSLALNDFIRDDYDLSSLMEQASIMTKVLRSKPIVARLNLVCPSYCPTRWTNQFDIFIWVLEHLDKLEKLITDATPQIANCLLQISNFPELIYLYIPKFLKIFASFRDLITFLEGDHQPACYLYPVIEEYREELFNEARDPNNDLSLLVNDLLQKIDVRLNNHYNYLQLRVLYYLTPAGREHARKTIYKDFLDEGKDGYHDEIKIDINYIKSEGKIKLLFEKNGPLDERYQNSKRIFQSFSDKSETEDIPENLNEDEDDIAYEKIEDDILDLDEETNESIIASYCDCIQNMMTKFNYAEKIDPEKNEQFISSLLVQWGDWIMKPITSPTLCSMMHRDPIKFWNAAKQENYLPHLACFALKLLPLVASEASVERKLWRQRIISPPDRSSNSEITELDRALLTESDF